MTGALPLSVRAVARLLPSSDREAIIGDLLEDAALRNLTGRRLHAWLCAECGSIAAGLSLTRVRAWLVVPPLRELAAGLAVDRRGVLRGAHPFSAVLRALVFCASVATLTLAVEILVGTLLSASGFGR